MGCSNTKEDEAPADQVDEKNGEKLLDDYYMGKLLGQGAAGAVYLCTKKNGWQEYAVKMIDQVETPLVDIKKEVAMLKKLAHPCVARLHSVYYETFFVCMVMEIYKGGDLIEGQQAHWTSKGLIPVPVVQNITKMMVQGIEWLHHNKVLHRDLKGDNYLMDRKGMEHPECRVYLCDFGTVQEANDGDRLNLKCGTKTYWSPEFYNLSYTLPVDVWAIGVIVYGMITCRFPFKTEEDTRNKPLKISSRLPKDGESFLRGVLERDENKRLTASGCMSHQFLSSIKSAAQVAEEKVDQSEKNAAATANIREGGANAAVKNRRQELLQREEDAHSARQKGVGNDALKMVRHRNSIVVTSDQLLADFEVSDKQKDKKSKFGWWNQAQCDEAKLKDWHGASPTKSSRGKSADDLLMREEQKKVEKMLVDHSIDISVFGTGQAKSMLEFATEIYKGQSQLMLDATKHKSIVRVVDVVLLRICYGSGSSKRYIIRSKEQWPDGRVREVNQLMGVKKFPWENGVETARRLLSERMGMQDCEVRFTQGHKEYLEEHENSPSYPGVSTVYRKEMFECTVVEPSEAILARLGVASGGSSEFSHKAADQYTRTYRWATEADIEQLKIKLRFSTEDFQVSSLIEAPVGYSEEELQTFLTDNNVDVSKFGVDGNKTLAAFSDELLTGKAALTRKEDGRIVRVVDLVVLDVEKEDGTTLVELSESKLSGGPEMPLNRMPAIKRRPDENMFWAAKRLLTRVMKISDVLVSIDGENIVVFEEEKDSSAYAGLPTVYRKVVISASATAGM